MPRRTRLLWPLKSNHYLRQWSVFIWMNSQSSMHKPTCICTVRSSNKLFWNSIWQESKSSSARVPEVTSMQVCECIGEKWKIPTPDILAWGLFTSGSSRAVIGHLSSDGEGSRFKARLSPRVKRAESDWEATVTLGCPRWGDSETLVHQVFHPFQFSYHMLAFNRYRIRQKESTMTPASLSSNAQSTAWPHFPVCGQGSLPCWYWSCGYLCLLFPCLFWVSRLE
jgi:hypothetical protein